MQCNFTCSYNPSLNVSQSHHGIGRIAFIKGDGNWTKAVKSSENIPTLSYDEEAGLIHCSPNSCCVVWSWDIGLQQSPHSGCCVKDFCTSSIYFCSSQTTMRAFTQQSWIISPCTPLSNSWACLMESVTGYHSTLNCSHGDNWCWKC